MVATMVMVVNWWLSPFHIVLALYSLLAWHRQQPLVYYCHTLVSLGYFMRFQNNWIPLFFDQLNMRFEYTYFFPRPFSKCCHQISMDHFTLAEFHHRNLHLLLSDDYACVCEYFGSKRSEIVCLYFQFECALRMQQFATNFVAFIEKHSCGGRAFTCLFQKLNWRKQTKRREQNRMNGVNGTAANYKLIKMITFRFEILLLCATSMVTDAAGENSHSVSIRTSSQPTTPNNRQFNWNVFF